MLTVMLEPPSPTCAGDQIYRTQQPCAELACIDGVYAVCGTWLSPIAHKLAAVADVLVLCQSVDADLLPLLAHRRARGRLTVYEINDNFLHPHPKQTVAAFYRNPKNTALAMQLARSADRLQLSAWGLVAPFAHLHDRWAVIPNACLMPARPAPRPPTGGGAPQRLGWGGSAGHFDDVRWLIPALRAVLQRRPRVQLHIMAPQALRPLFAWVPPQRLVFQSFGSLRAYQTFLDGLDVGVAPLLDTPFNRGRSDVKFLEYSAAGVPGVYSHAPAYAKSVVHRSRGLLAKTRAEFVAHILQLLDDPAFGRHLVAHARAYAGTHRSGAALCRRRLEFWGVPPAAPGAPAPAPWRHLGPAHKVGTRHAHLHWGQLEHCLYTGLVATNAVAQCAAWEQAAQLAPQFYLPHLYLGHAYPAPQQARAALRRALRLMPTSGAAREALARLLAHDGRRDEAARLWADSAAWTNDAHAANV